MRGNISLRVILVVLWALVLCQPPLTHTDTLSPSSKQDRLCGILPLSGRWDGELSEWALGCLLCNSQGTGGTAALMFYSIEQITYIHENRISWDTHHKASVLPLFSCQNCPTTPKSHTHKHRLPRVCVHIFVYIVSPWCTVCVCACLRACGCAQGCCRITSTLAVMSHDRSFILCDCEVTVICFYLLWTCVGSTRLANDHRVSNGLVLRAPLSL